MGFLRGLRRKAGIKVFDTFPRTRYLWIGVVQSLGEKLKWIVR